MRTRTSGERHTQSVWMIEWFCQTGRRRCNRNKAEERRRCRGQNPFTLHSSDQWTRLPLASCPPLPFTSPLLYCYRMCVYTCRNPLAPSLSVFASTWICISICICRFNCICICICCISSWARRLCHFYAHNLSLNWRILCAPSVPLLHLSFAPFLLALLVVIHISH